MTSVIQGMLIFLASAESYLNECLGIYQAVHGPHHIDTIETEDELARLMIGMDRQEVICFVM